MPTGRGLSHKYEKTSEILIWHASNITNKLSVANRHIALLGLQNNCHNQTVQPQSLGKNKNEHHSDVQTRLLSRCAHTRVADDANRKTSRQVRETTCKASTQVGVAVE